MLENLLQINLVYVARLRYALAYLRHQDQDQQESGQHLRHPDPDAFLQAATFAFKP